MIQKLELSGVNFDVDDDLRKYAIKKIGRLDQYAPRQARASFHTAIKLKEGKGKQKDERTCEVIMHLPHETLTIHETTINMYAAIDIAEAKLKTQLKKYKDLHADPKLHRRLFARTTTE